MPFDTDFVHGIGLQKSLSLPTALLLDKGAKETAKTTLLLHIAQHSTAQHSTAQHSTAQHSIERRVP